MTKDRMRLVINIVILSAAAALLAAGIAGGGMRDIFIKASKICSECIGLG